MLLKLYSYINISLFLYSIFFILLISLFSFLYYYFIILNINNKIWIKGIPLIKKNLFVGIKHFFNGKILYNVINKNGPILQFLFFNKKILIISDKEIAKIALKEINGKGFFHNPTPSFVTDSIFSYDTGPEWQKRRAAFRKAFSTLSLRYHINSVIKMNEKLCTILNKYSETGEICRMDRIFTQLTVGVICELAFELDVKVFESTSNSLRIDDAMEHLFKYGWVRRLPFAKYLYKLPFYPFNNYRKARIEFEDKMGYIYDHMKKLRDENKLREDSMALALVNFGDEPDIERRHMIAEIGTFFVAGMDTTAHTLSFFIYALARYQDIQKKCQNEVDLYLLNNNNNNHNKNDNNDSLNNNNNHMTTLPPYVEAVLKESMRKWPTAGPGSMRRVTEKNGIQLTPNLKVPYDWWILIPIYVLHNSTDSWGENVHEFIPERWLEKNEQSNNNNNNNNLVSPSSYSGCGYKSNELSFLPFSYGLRNCIGMNLALMELRITILHLVSKYSFYLTEENSSTDDDKIFETVFTLRPCNGCPIKVVKRDL